MADIILSIDDTLIAPIVDSIAANSGYQEMIDDPAWLAEVEDLPDNPGTFIPNPVPQGQVANPISKNKNARKQLYRWLRGQYRTRKLAEANTVRSATLDQVDIDVSIVDEA